MRRTVLGLLLFLATTFMFIGCGASETTTTEDLTTGLNILGTVTVEIVTAGDDPSTDAVETEYVSNEISIDYHETDTLFTLLYQNFDFACKLSDGSRDPWCEDTPEGSRYLTEIDTLVASESNQYIAFYINGGYAMTGVDTTPLHDGDVYLFKIETF